MSTQRYNKYILLALGVGILGAVVAGNYKYSSPSHGSVEADTSVAENNATVVRRGTADQTNQAVPLPPSGIYMDAQERALYAEDPSSAGYTDSDRDFLNEHGVSEQEARALETVLHKNGID
jgi:hypothetical protein